MFDPMAFKQVVLDSRLTKGEIATLYGVSRQTVYDWLKGGVPRPGSPMDRMVGPITSALRNAILRKLLPLPASTPDVRRRKVASMAKTLQNLKPSPVR